MRRPSRRIAYQGLGLSVPAHVRNLFDMTYQYRAVLSPCIGICNIDDDGLCAGCHRTGAEIAHWPVMNDDNRLRMLDEVLPQRAAHRGKE